MQQNIWPLRFSFAAPLIRLNNQLCKAVGTPPLLPCRGVVNGLNLEHGSLTSMPTHRSRYRPKPLLMTEYRRLRRSSPDKQLGPYQGCPGRRRTGATLNFFRGSFDRAVQMEPVTFAADAVRLWELNRLSPVSSSCG